jgi:hypothetical protein
VCASLSLLLGIFPGPITRASRLAAIAAVTHPVVRPGEVAFAADQPGLGRPAPSVHH